MPPHCDSLDGPVVSAARRALDTDDVEVVLPYVAEDDESEVRAVFAAVQPVCSLGDAATEVAERHFFETVVRLHRAGEGAPYTGLKPAGLDVGPVIPLAERAIQTGSAEAVEHLLAGVLHDELKGRLDHVNTLATARDQSVPQARAYVQAMLDFQLYSQHLLEAMRGRAHSHAPL